jgi:membrane-associated phospholipid phosphatase
MNSINRYVLILLTVLSTFSFTNSLHAADSLHTHNTIWQNLGGDIVTSLNDAGQFFTSPLRFSGRDWLYTGGTFVAIGVFMSTDKEMKNRLGRNTTSSINHDLWDIPTDYGNALITGSLCCTFYGVGLFSGDNWIRVTGRMLLESLAFAGSLGTAVKFITGRERPYISESQWNFKWFQTKDESLSFPSGHAIVAFSVSTVLAERIDNNFVRAGLYGFAGLAAIARVVNNQHWLSDVVTGGLLGFCSGYFVVHEEQQREQGIKGGSSFTIYPSFNGLNAVWKF